MLSKHEGLIFLKENMIFLFVLILECKTYILDQFCKINPFYGLNPVYFCLSFCAVKKTFIGQNKSIWAPLELIEKLCPESADIATSVRDMPGIKYVPFTGVCLGYNILFETA